MSSDFFMPRLRAGNNGADGAAPSNVEGRPPCRPTSLCRACARETTALTEQRPPMWRDDLRVVRLLHAAPARGKQRR